MIAEWFLSAAPCVSGGDDLDVGNVLMNPVQTIPEDFDLDVVEALECAVKYAPTHVAAVREARAWRERVMPTQSGRGRRPPGPTLARHLLSLVGCCPIEEVENILPSLWKELLLLIKGKEAEETRVVAFLAMEELLHRLLGCDLGRGVVEGRKGGSGIGTAGVGTGLTEGIGSGGSRQVCFVHTVHLR
ncbi:unnamed protein product [Discosporangium mesarthrocarpum]